jgi:hypothetical protein
MQKWNQTEELELIKLIKNKVSMVDIVKKLNRDLFDVEARLEKIIYENVTKNGKDMKYISDILNMSYEEVLKKFNSYKNKKEINNNLDEKIEKIERENRFIRSILENKILHKKLNNMIKNEKINKEVLEVIKEMRKK